MASLHSTFGTATANYSLGYDTTGSMLDDNRYNQLLSSED